MKNLLCRPAVLAAVVASVMASLAAAPAWAGPGDAPQRRVQFYDNAGTLMEMDNFNDPAKLAEMMKHAKKLAPGTIVMTVDGQVFILQDFKTTGGAMMTDELQH